MGITHTYTPMIRLNWKVGFAYKFPLNEPPRVISAAEVNLTVRISSYYPDTSYTCVQLLSLCAYSTGVLSSGLSFGGRVGYATAHFCRFGWRWGCRGFRNISY